MSYHSHLKKLKDLKNNPPEVEQEPTEEPKVKDNHERIVKLIDEMDISKYRKPVNDKD